MSNCEICGAMLEGGATCPRCGAELPADRSAKALSQGFPRHRRHPRSRRRIRPRLRAARGMEGCGWSLIGLASARRCAGSSSASPCSSIGSPALFLPIMGAAILAYLWAPRQPHRGLRAGSSPSPCPSALAAHGLGRPCDLAVPQGEAPGPERRGLHPRFGAPWPASPSRACSRCTFRGYSRSPGRAIVAASALPVALLLLGIQHRLRQPDARAFRSRIRRCRVARDAALGRDRRQLGGQAPAQLRYLDPVGPRLARGPLGLEGHHEGVGEGPGLGLHVAQIPDLDAGLLPRLADRPPPPGSRPPRRSPR